MQRMMPLIITPSVLSKARSWSWIIVHRDSAKLLHGRRPLLLLLPVLAVRVGEEPRPVHRHLAAASLHPEPRTPRRLRMLGPSRGGHGGSPEWSQGWSTAHIRGRGGGGHGRSPRGRAERRRRRRRQGGSPGHPGRRLASTPSRGGGSPGNTGDCGVSLASSDSGTGAGGAVRLGHGHGPAGSRSYRWFAAV